LKHTQPGQLTVAFSLATQADEVRNAAALTAVLFCCVLLPIFSLCTRTSTPI